MHSRIYQISTKPIAKEDYITESDYTYDHWFTRTIADYVNGKTSRDYDIKWLRNHLGKAAECGTDKDGSYFIIKDKNEFFRGRFKQFSEVLDEIRSYGLDEFSNNKESDFSFKMWRLKYTYNDEFDFYVDDNGEYFGLITLSYFIRQVEINKKYYIGGTMDYHF